MHQVIPIAVAALGGVQPEGGQEVLRMPGGQAAFLEDAAQHGRNAVSVIFSEQPSLKAIEQRQFLVLCERGVVGDVVGRPHELIKGEDWSAMPRADQARGDRKILVAVAFP